jgi:sporulation protein YlmC with PRC-barrel domain
MNRSILRILATALLVAASSAWAQGETRTDLFLPFGEEDDVLATSLVGAEVYTSPATVEITRVDAVPTDWTRVATIQNVVIGADGAVRGVLVDFGGFLGIGTRTVMVRMDALGVVRQVDSDVVHVVLHATREDLEAAPTYAPFDPAVAERRAADAIGRVGVVDPAVGYQRIEWSTLTVEELRGAEVVDRHHEPVSSIRDLLLDADQRVVAALIDVGGFLGLGARTVAVPMELLEIHEGAEGAALRVYLALTDAELRDLPPHE